MYHVDFSLVSRIVHIIAEALVFRRIIEFLGISFLNSRMSNRCGTWTSSRIRASRTITLAWRISYLLVLSLLESQRITGLLW